MKKMLLLLRHAKSSWDDPALDDHERPLNGRGRKSAELIGRNLRQEALKLDLILCSTSVRTKQTADLVFATWDQPPEISYRDDLYHASPSEMRRIVAEVPDSAVTVLIIGHNPGFEQLLGEITATRKSFPTAGLAHIELDLDKWRQFNASSHGQLIKMWRPKEMGLE